MSEVRTYYGRPVIKEPTWTWQVPAYLFTGGLSGASSVLSLCARLARNDRLARAALYAGATADLVSPVLLISDLGRPERFHHMLRVFKPTSPMNVGSWILSVNSSASVTAALLEHLRLCKPLRLLAELAGATAGPGLATYTGVLFADTAVPVWHDARRELPWLFGASATASAGAVACALVDPAYAGPARRLAVGGVAAEGTAMQLMTRRLGEAGKVYRQGSAGKLSRLAKVLATGGAGLIAARGRRSRGAAALGGALVCAGELCLRYAVLHAGRQSARDPVYTVKPQRERLASRRNGT